METEEEIQNVNVHHGHNIRRTRIEKNIKQERRPPCLALCCDTCMMPRTAAQGAPCMQ